MSKITINPTIQPLPKQHSAWELLQDNETKYILFGGGAGGGKSWLGAEWLIVMCYRYPASKWFIGRKKLTTLMASSYLTFKKVCTYHKIPKDDWKFNGKYNYIEFSNGSRVDLLDLKENPGDPEFEDLGSTEYTGGWIEEAGEIAFKAFDVLKSRIGRHMNQEYKIHPKLLITANPKKNWLKRMIWKPWKDGTLKLPYAYVQSLYSDNHFTADSYGENLSEIADKVTRQRLRDGNWNYDDDDNCLVDSRSISDIWTNTPAESNKKYAVLDVARFGTDFTKLYLWQGLKVYKIIKWAKQGTDITAIKLKTILEKEQIPYSQVIIDEVGVGSGVIDQMSGVNGFIANSSPLEREDTEKKPVMMDGKLKYKTSKDNFRYLKDQCGWLLADMVNSHKIGVDTENEELKEVIEEELSELKDAKPDEDGKKQLVTKDEIKENIGRSPDDLDCLLMRMWFELAPYEKSKSKHKTRQYRPTY